MIPQFLRFLIAGGIRQRQTMDRGSYSASELPVGMTVAFALMRRLDFDAPAGVLRAQISKFSF